VADADAGEEGGEMGVGGSFWDLLKPYARQEGPGFLRGRRVAVDLSFWIVSHSTAIRARSPHARHPHIRTTFFRTLALFSKVGPSGWLPSPSPSLRRPSPPFACVDCLWISRLVAVAAC
jgi:hypothetical protein